MAQETKHKPGPWFANLNTAGYYDISIGPEDYSQSFAAVHPNPHIEGCVERLEANARLIASAPDLLEALQAYVDADDDRRIELARDHAIGVLAKAEGSA